MDLLNITMGCPYVNPHVNRPYDRGPYEPPEPPLAGVGRMYRLTGQAQRAFPGLAVVASGPSYLRQYGANLAAGAVEQDYADMVGFGRMAFAYPAFARDILNGCFDNKQVCITCAKCSELMRGSRAGCVVRDGVYTELYRKMKAGNP
jgi:2,4-dienoyl-CoA reductase-like NADH-dependent reductase (Old Yellow Enzyme family)